MFFGGMKWCLMIVCVLVYQLCLLIFDEFIVGVDIELCCLMWSFFIEFNQEGISIIFIIYYLEEVEQFCCNIVIIDYGEIVQNISMCDLLMILYLEIFLFDLKNVQVLLLIFDGYLMWLVDDYIFEVQVEKSQGINDLFVQLGV